MLRRRILASAMASVMALGSVAIVASAEETAVKPVKTKADLEALVGASGTYGDAYRSNDIYNYGTKYSDLMLDTLEFADTVLDNADATVDDYTAAYDMVIAVSKKATLYTAAELKELMDSCKSIYERDNINNEDLGDLIYTAKSFSAFVDAYEDAESVVNSSDSRIITDAYIGLDGAKKDLVALASVTKSDFTAAIKAMEKAFDKEMAYDQWRRGMVQGNPSVVLDMGGAEGWYFAWQNRSYGDLIDQLWNYTDEIYKRYDEFVEVKTASKTTIEEIVNAWKAAVEISELINLWAPDNTNRATKASVTKLLDQYHGVMVYDFCKDDAEDLLASIYKTVITGGMAADTNKPDPDKFDDPDKYDEAVVAWEKAWAEKFQCEARNGVTNTTYNVTTPGATVGVETSDFNKYGHYIVDEVQNKGTNWNTTPATKYDLPKKQPVAARMNVKSGVAYYIMLDANGYAKYTVNAVSGDKEYDIRLTPPSTGDYKKISAGVKVDITEYVYVPASVSDDVDDHDGNEGDPKGGFTTENKVFDGDAWSVVFFKDLKDKINTTDPEYYDGNPASIRGKDNFVALKDVLPLVYEYLNDEYDVNGGTLAYDIYDLDTIDQIAAGTAKRSASEWTLLYRALKYCLEDRYGSASPCTHTRSDIEKLIEDSYTLEDRTSKAAIFADSLTEMITAREKAREWLKAAKADRKYKDNITKIDDLFADEMYHKLEEKYGKLADDLKHFSVAYGDVYAKIAEVETMIDEGELDETAELRTAIEAAAYALAVVTAPKLNEEPGKSDTGADLDDDPYTDDRYFLEFNRVFTSTEEYEIKVKDKKCVVVKSADHVALMEAYNALVAAAEAKPAELIGDYDGSGKVDAMDAAAILKDIAAAAELKAIGDYDASGTVNALDAAAILKAVADGIL